MLDIIQPRSRLFDGNLVVPIEVTWRRVNQLGLSCFSCPDSPRIVEVCRNYHSLPEPVTAHYHSLPEPETAHYIRTHRPAYTHTHTDIDTSASKEKKLSKEIFYIFHFLQGLTKNPTLLWEQKNIYFPNCLFSLGAWSLIYRQTQKPINNLGNESCNKQTITRGSLAWC